MFFVSKQDLLCEQGSRKQREGYRLTQLLALLSESSGCVIAGS